MNLNTFAKEITLAEGKKVNLSIAQVKEVIKLVLQKLHQMTLAEIIDLLKKQA
jgi:predicted DNA-binding antitoxin AbrB/MazE fold protein